MVSTRQSGSDPWQVLRSALPQLRHQLTKPILLAWAAYTSACNDRRDVAVRGAHGAHRWRLLHSAMSAFMHAVRDHKAAVLIRRGVKERTKDATELMLKVANAEQERWLVSEQLSAMQQEVLLLRSLDAAKGFANASLWKQFGNTMLMQAIGAVQAACLQLEDQCHDLRPILKEGESLDTLHNMSVEQVLARWTSKMSGLPCTDLSTSLHDNVILIGILQNVANEELELGPEDIVVPAGGGIDEEGEKVVVMEPVVAPKLSAVEEEKEAVKRRAVQVARIAIRLSLMTEDALLPSLEIRLEKPQQPKKKKTSTSSSAAAAAAASPKTRSASFRNNNAGWNSPANSGKIRPGGGSGFMVVDLDEQRNGNGNGGGGDHQSRWDSALSETAELLDSNTAFSSGMSASSTSKMKMQRQASVDVGGGSRDSTPRGSGLIGPFLGATGGGVNEEDVDSYADSVHAQVVAALFMYLPGMPASQSLKVSSAPLLNKLQNMWTEVREEKSASVGLQKGLADVSEVAGETWSLVLNQMQELMRADAAYQALRTRTMFWLRRELEMQARIRQRMLDRQGVSSPMGSPLPTGTHVVLPAGPLPSIIKRNSRRSRAILWRGQGTT